MGDLIEFTNSYNDLSTDQGFQFEVNCDRCGSGFRSTFKPSMTGTISGVLDAANSVFGGLFGTASNLSSRVHSAAWKKAHDDAFVEALRELQQSFIQCPRCQSWVCKRKCWNEKRGLCKGCAPDLGVEMSAAQANHSVQEIWAHAVMADEDKKLDAEQWRKTIKASCPKCGVALTTNAKFCPECGERLEDPKCKKCGTVLPPKSKFCPDCGEKV
jgi:uncharacterized OB-fold protein